MIEAVTRYFKEDGTPEEDVKRLLELEKTLASVGFLGDYGFVLRTYNDYQSFGRYPFGSGAFVEQPQWLLEDFDTMTLLGERERLRKKYAKKTRTPPNTPSLEERLRRQREMTHGE